MTELPNNVEQLKMMLLKLQEENYRLKKTIETQAEEVIELENRMQLLIEQLNLSKSKRFSAKSEKEPKALLMKLSNKMPFQNPPRNIGRAKNNPSKSQCRTS